MSNPLIRALVGARVSHVQGEEKTSHLTQRGKGEAYAESQGWVDVETDRTYAEVWSSASVEEKRKMMVDAGVVLWVTNKNDYYVGDIDHLLGDGEADSDLLASTVLRRAGLTG